VPRIRDASVREAVDAADMVEVVSARTQLRRSGARWTGLCPFHDEKTPSFSVNPADKLFYCFGCGQGGDIISFVRETEQLDFAQAVEWLAERYRVTLEYEESSPEQDAARGRRERLLSLLEQATRFYERFLWESPRGEAARAYLAGRGLGEEVCRTYRLGLAPGGATLSRKAREKGFTAAELAAAGLVNRRGNDYFNGRLLFPLADARGRVRGSCARTTRCARSTSIRLRASSSARATCCTGSTGRARRSPSRNGRSSSRATPTCSRCGRPGWSRWSRRWGRRSRSGS
jgi:DNA primase